MNKFLAQYGYKKQYNNRSSYSSLHSTTTFCLFGCSRYDFHQGCEKEEDTNEDVREPVDLNLTLVGLVPEPFYVCSGAVFVLWEQIVVVKTWFVGVCVRVFLVILSMFSVGGISGIDSKMSILETKHEIDKTSELSTARWESGKQSVYSVGNQCYSNLWEGCV